MANDPIYHNVRRNASCPCGSGNRFKYCHGKSSSQQSPTSSKLKSQNCLLENDELFCTVEGKYYDLDHNTQYLFAANDSNAKIPLDLISSHIFHDLKVFASFKEHFTSCSNKFGISEEEFRSSIDILFQKGLLKSAKLVIESLKKPTRSISSELAGICIRTCESPPYLKRILDSQIRRKNKYGANEKVYVFDDSSSDQARNKNKQIVENASNQIEVFYLGLEWQREFVSTLIDTFPEDNTIIQAMLLPQENVSFSGGRIMNLALLFFAGKRYLNFDDDFILDDAKTHKYNTSNAIQIGLRPDRIYDGFDNEYHAMQAGTPLDVDPLSLHKKSLGLTLSEYASTQEDYQINSESLTGLSSYELKRYHSDSFIITTGNGWFGTSGKRDGRFIFSASYVNLPPPWKTSINFEQLLSGGYCWDSISQTEIIKRGVSTPAGINNTQLLAPTVSTCKGEDTLLCLMASVLYPDSVHLGFSWALAHFRLPKNWEEDTFNEAKPIQLPILISEVALSITLPSSVSNYERLEHIANALHKVAHLPEKQFLEKLKSIRLPISSSLIESLYKQIESLTDEDQKYKTIIERIITNDLDHLLSNKLPPIEDSIGDSEKDQIKWLQRELESYANSLIIWPKLWQHCAKNSFDQITK